MPALSHLLRPLVILVLSGWSSMTAVSSADADDSRCKVACPENSSCLPSSESACTTTNCKYECVCNHGWIGDDCMLQYEVCDDKITGALGDVRICYNGGQCEAYDLDTPDSDGKTTGMRCNCQTYANDTKAYAGFQCEYAAEQICIRDRFHSSYAFCTNNGTCKDLIDFGEKHPLCHCPSGFTGRHCQFNVSSIAGSAAPEEIELVNKLFYGNGTIYGSHSSTLSNDDDDELSSGMKFFVIFLVASVFLFCFCCYFCVIKKRRSKKEAESVQEQSKTNDSEII